MARKLTRSQKIAKAKKDVRFKNELLKELGLHAPVEELSETMLEKITGGALRVTSHSTEQCEIC